MELTWENYCTWRQTKCPQRDMTDPVQRDEEITQATLELIGEVAELNWILLQYKASFSQELVRDKVIDECGDCVFCASWVIDAWTKEPPWSGVEKIAECKETYLDTNLDILVQYASYCSGILANKLKKQKYQGKVQDPNFMTANAKSVILIIGSILNCFSSSIKEAMQVNIEKLNKRFPCGNKGDGGIR